MDCGPDRPGGRNWRSFGQALRGWVQVAGRRSDLAARGFAAWDRRTGAGRHGSWQGLAETLCREAPTVISVDVFDTVISRRVVSDDAVFWLTGVAMVRAGSWQGAVEGFVRARYTAAAARPDGTLEDIYRQPVLADRSAAQTGPSVEAAVENDLAIPVPGAREALDCLRNAGHRLVFVSDMHLSRGHVMACLTAHGLAAPEDRLVVSSDVGASKWSGTLFPWLRHNVDADLSVHIGNDPWSDVAMAQRAGLRAMPLRRAEPTELERVMAQGPGSVGAAVAGAARQARWGATGSRVDQALRETGADVAGQCLVAFLLWIRLQCLPAGVNQVAFLARDGELPLQMARAMPPDHWEGFTLQYLHGSRRLWSIAAAAVLGVPAWLEAGTADDISFIRQGQHSIPFGSLLARVALTEEDLAGHDALAALDLCQPLPEDTDHEWRSLLSERSVRDRIAARADEQYAALRDLLVDQGIQGSRVALVDVGWRGELAWQVSAVLRAVTGHEPVHLHFGGVDVAVGPSSSTDIRRFAVDDSVTPLPFPDVVSCVETFTASGGPRARSLQRDEHGTVRLVFDRALPDMDTDHRRLLWGSAIEVARNFPSRSTLDGWSLASADLAEPVRKVLSRFWLTPSSQHALAGAHLSAEVDDAGYNVRPVANPYGLGPSTGAASRTWRQGSLQLTSPALRLIVCVGLRVRSGTRRSV